MQLANRTSPGSFTARLETDSWALGLPALWGFAEATLFFVVPDLIVGLVALFHPRKGWSAGVAAVAGACVGGAVLYLIGHQIDTDLREVMDAVPFVPADMLDEVQRAVLRDGGWAIVDGPTRGIPYKLYAAEWSLQGYGLVSLELWTIPARAIRIVGFGYVLGLVGRVLRTRIQSHPMRWLALYIAAWALFYAYFWFVVIPAQY